MATLTAARAASTFPVYAGTHGNLRAAFGTYTLGTNPTQGDVIQFCKIPAGATVIGGWVRSADIDTGTETFELDIGWAANGDEEADADGFGDFGVWTGDAVTGIKPEAGNYYPLGGVLFSAGPKTFNAETTITGTVAAAAQSGGTGQITVVVLYIIP